MNTITLCGRLGRDAESKIFDSGQRVLNLSLATHFQRGEKEETLWWRVSVWGDRFKQMEPYLKKGSALIVVGTMHYPRIYQDQDGTNQLSLDVTANNIKFSPFGGLPEQETQATQTTSSSKDIGQAKQGQGNSEDISKVFDENYGLEDGPQKSQ